MERSGKVLIIMRPFSDKSIINNEHVDHFVLSFQETRDWLTECKKLIGSEVDIVFLKMHPSSSKALVAQLLDEVSFSIPVVISEDDIYSCVAKVDKVFGFYSTTLLIASAHGCETYCMKTQLVERSFLDWPVLSEVYSDFGVQMIQLGQESDTSNARHSVAKLGHYPENSSAYCADLFSGSL